MRGVANTKAKELEESQASLEKQAEEFMRERQQWEDKEVEYQKDIKKLEITVASGARGLDLVWQSRCFHISRHASILRFVTD
jgi:hypothetical protein